MTEKLICVLIIVCIGSTSFAYAQTEVTYEELKLRYVPQSTPERTYRLEIKLLSQGIYCYDLPIYDPDWRKRGRDIRYSSSYKRTAEKMNIPFKVYRENRYAVIYFYGDKSAGPVFLFKDAYGWVIDRTAVWNYIHYNTSNTGWFAYEGDYTYLKMLRKIFSLKRIKLDSGNWAYMIK